MAFNPIALRMAKILWSFGRSECNRVWKSASGTVVKGSVSNLYTSCGYNEDVYVVLLKR